MDTNNSLLTKLLIFYLEVPLVFIVQVLVAVQADHFSLVVADVTVRLLGTEIKVIS